MFKPKVQQQILNYNLLYGILFVFILITSNKMLLAQVEPTCSNQANKLLHHLMHSQYDSAWVLFDDEMKKLFPVEQMDGFWESLEYTFGDFTALGEPEVFTEDTLCIVDIKIIFKRAKMKLRTAWHNNLASGLFIMPDQVLYQPANYVNASKFFELKINTAVKGFENDGILTMPIGVAKAPVVIIVGGSGPTDKDGSLGPNKPYRDIAEGLATRGIAVYRYNKRTVAHAKKMDKDITVKEEYLTDLLTVIKQLKKQPGINANHIFILGHSQGGYLLPYFAKHAKKIKGYIGLAPGFKNMEDAIYKQLTYIKSISKNSADTFMLNKMLSYAGYMKTNLRKNTPADSLMPGLTANYLLHLQSINPKNMVNYLAGKPLLILHAEKDYQVNEEDLDLWVKYYGNISRFKAITIKDANHIFIKVNTTNAYCTPRDYQIPGNVEENVILLLEKWIKQTTNNIN
jgi:dienelactone hydrolase